MLDAVQAVSLRLLPPNQAITLGDTVTISIEVSDLGNFQTPSLSTNQPNSFILSRLNFQGIAPGISPLDLSVSPDGILDEDLNFLNVSTIQQASITVNNNPTTTPEPSSRYVTLGVF